MPLKGATMQEKIIKHFITLTKIPHCSQETEQLLLFLETFAKERGYSIEIDESKNILIKKGTPRLVLQAHYDMVCMGKAPLIETVIEEGWMSAKASSLGADNGMAIAMMMELMEQGEELEFLLTADEEIGLVGASALALKLDSSTMLNIDFEDEAEVCIGCAGGADLLALQSFKESTPLLYNYKVSVIGLAGGHSGVDIDKGIPNAIKLLVDYLSDKEVRISLFEGGERRNSIPANARVWLSSSEILKSTDRVKVEPLKDELMVYESEDFLNLLIDFEDGVNSFNKEFDLPDTSINLAMVHFKEGEALIESSARAMDDKGLKEICEKNMHLFAKYGFEGSDAYKYPAWKPKINAFTKQVNGAMMSVFGHSNYTAIHAGLECGVISKKYPHMQFASIGPTIHYPHSTRERVKLDSVSKIFQVIEKLILE